MQFYTNNRWRPLRITLFFGIIIWIAYLPVSSFLFFLKNDAFTGYFPPKFFMSESLQAGYIPLWNPYINFGIPQYGDMSSAYWSPLTWLVAGTIGYNAYTFTLELLMYILMGGLGMYRLTGYYRVHPTIRQVSGISYACCGFFVGHLQHFNWISGAALIPWCFWAWLRLLDTHRWSDLLRASLLFSLLLASAHPGISIALMYFLAGYFIFHMVFNKIPHRSPFSSLMLRHIGLLIGMLILSAGMIAGYADILPYFVRGNQLSLQDALLQPTTASCWISLLLPFVTVKESALFIADISMRNCYIGLPFLVFLLTGLFRRKTPLQFFLLGAAVFFILLAGGGVFKTLAYRFLPLMGYVRLNGEFRIFALFCLILFSSLSLQQYILPWSSLPKHFSRWCYMLTVLLLLAFASGWYMNIHNQVGLLYQMSSVFKQTSFTGKLKAGIDALSTGDTLWMQAVLQLMILVGIQQSLIYKRWVLFRTLAVADLVMATLLQIPFTGAGQLPVSAIQQLINQSPKGIPIPSLVPIGQREKKYPDTGPVIGEWSLYSKEPGTVKQIPYPIVLKNMQAFFDSDSSKRNRFLQQPFLFSSSSDAQIKIISFSPQKITVTVSAASAGELILQQNKYPHWNYAIDNQPAESVKPEGSFMSASIPSGTHNIQWTFNPHWIKTMLFFSLGAWCVGCLLLLIGSWRQHSIMQQSVD